MKNEKPLILISNDDGITAPGIRVLTSIMREFGEVIVVAPNSPQSGQGHAITIGEPLRIEKNTIYHGIEAFETSGTPADCVKLAKHLVLKKRKPDLVVSGINHGANTSVNVIYSGTMSAAIEAAMEGIPAIGFSLCEYSHEADMTHTIPHIRKIVANTLEKGLPKATALNVNFPAKQDEPIKGIKICRQANAYWKEDFEERIDPNKRKYFWMIGEFVNKDKGTDTDIWAIENNYTSIVPCSFDLTNYNGIEQLKKDW